MSADWRKWVLPSVVRGSVAVGFAGVPAISPRFGDVAFILVCCVLATCIGVVIGLDWYSRRSELRRELLVDAVSLLSLVPVATIAGELLVADGRFGGRTSNVLAMLGVSLVIMMILAVVSRVSLDGSTQSSALSILPAAMTIAAVIGGAKIYGTAQVWQGVSVAWMAAGITTMTAIFAGARWRLLVAVFALIIFAIVTLVISSVSDGPNINNEAASFGIVAVGLTIGIVVFEAMTNVPQRSPGAEQRWAGYK